MSNKGRIAALVLLVASTLMLISISLQQNGGGQWFDFKVPDVVPSSQPKLGFVIVIDEVDSTAPIMGILKTSSFVPDLESKGADVTIIDEDNDAARAYDKVLEGINPPAIILLGEKNASGQSKLIEAFEIPDSIDEIIKRIEDVSDYAD